MPTSIYYNLASKEILGVWSDSSANSESHQSIAWGHNIRPEVPVEERGYIFVDLDWAPAVGGFLIFDSDGAPTGQRFVRADAEVIVKRVRVATPEFDESTHHLFHRKIRLDSAERAARPMSESSRRFDSHHAHLHALSTERFFASMIAEAVIASTSDRYFNSATFRPDNYQSFWAADRIIARVQKAAPIAAEVVMAGFGDHRRVACDFDLDAFIAGIIATDKRDPSSPPLAEGATRADADRGWLGDVIAPAPDNNYNGGDDLESGLLMIKARAAAAAAAEGVVVTALGENSVYQVVSADPHTFNSQPQGIYIAGGEHFVDGALVHSSAHFCYGPIHAGIALYRPTSISGEVFARIENHLTRAIVVGAETIEPGGSVALRASDFVDSITPIAIGFPPPAPPAE